MLEIDGRGLRGRGRISAYWQPNFDLRLFLVFGQPRHIYFLCGSTDLETLSGYPAL